MRRATDCPQLRFQLINGVADRDLHLCCAARLCGSDGPASVHGGIILSRKN